MDTESTAHIRIIDTNTERREQLECGLGEDPFFRIWTEANLLEAEALVIVEPASPAVLREPIERFARAWGAVFVALPLARAQESEAFEAAGAGVLMKLPLNVDELGVRLKSAIKRARLAGTPARASVRGPGELIGASEVMRYIYELITRTACVDANTLVLGETGTGKELVAQAIHTISRRSAGPFVAVNLSAVVPELLESELFGHAAGAFTGAKSARVGKLEAAAGGTLFLDEIGDFPLAAQVKLLRVIQEREFSRVGENSVRRADFRLISATHRDLEAMVEEGSFREDLYYRLNVVQLDLPPLRDRGEDLVLLARHFLDHATARRGVGASLSPAAEQALTAHDWPGNVRELQHTIERAIALLQPGEPLGPHQLRLQRRRLREPSSTTLELVDVLVEHSAGIDEALGELERQALARALTKAEGNRSEAARLLKLPRQTLQSRMRKYGLS